jgi:hypothetical protein
MRLDVVRSNAREIEVYLEVLVPKFEPGGGVPDLPLSRKERGSWRPPVSDHILALWYKNIHAGRINWALRRAQTGTDGLVKIEGEYMRDILAECLSDHTAIRRWKDENGLEERRFYKMCLLFAYVLAQEYDSQHESYEIRVWINADDEPAARRTHQGIKVNTFYTQRRMVEQLEEVEEELGCKGMRAMQVLSERKRAEGKDWSVHKIRRARTEVNRSRSQGQRRVVA